MVERNMTEEQRQRKREKDNRKDKGKGGETERRRGGTRTVTRSEKELFRRAMLRWSSSTFFTFFLLTFETKRKEKTDH